MPSAQGPRPWTLEGDDDPAYSDAERRYNRRLLTDPLLRVHFRRRFPLRWPRGYEDMVRALGAVWECPDDGTVNVTGYCCAGCRRSHPRASP